MIQILLPKHASHLVSDLRYILKNFTSSRLLKNEKTVISKRPNLNRVGAFAKLKFELLPFEWWRMTGSNRRPPACKAGALPAELIPRVAVAI